MIFGKKDKNENKEEEIKEVTPEIKKEEEQSNNENNENMEAEKVALQSFSSFGATVLADAISASWEKCEAKGNTIFLQESRVMFRVEAIKVMEEESSVANILVMAEHEGLPEVFSDFIASFGKTGKDAVASAISAYFLADINVLKKYVTKKEISAKISTDFFGRKHEFNLYESQIVGSGSITLPENTTVNFWNNIKDKIKNHIGTRKVSWVKVFCAKVNGEAIAECRVNDVVSKELSNLFLDYVNSWQTDSMYVTQKQIFFIEETEETHLFYPYSKKQIEEYTRYAINMLSYDEEDKSNDLYKLTNDICLTRELCCFIPEICCYLLFQQADYGEIFELAYPNDISVTVYKDQITSYKWICDEVANCFFNNPKIYNDNLFKNILLRSSSASAISNMLAKDPNTDLENAHLTISFIVENEYFAR